MTGASQIAPIDDAALALGYRLLSLAFSPPAPGVTEELATLASVLAAAGSGDPGLDELIGELAAAVVAPEAVGSLPAAYEDVLGGRALCAPYEGSYERDPFRSTRQLADVSGIYRAFGAEPGGPAAERPDHAGCELEFLAFLIARRLEAEAAGDAEHADVCREAEDVFLEQHLGRWLPELVRGIVASSPFPFYTAAALLAERLLALDLARRGLLPKPAARGVPTAVEDDEVECGGELAPAGEPSARP